MNELANRKYSVQFIKDTVNRQKNYTLISGLAPVIPCDEPVKRYILVRNNKLLQIIPRETPKHQITMMSEILQAVIMKLEFEVIYVVAGQEAYGPKEYNIVGEITGIPAIVVNNEIIGIYPEQTGENKFTYDALRTAAKALGGDMVSLLVTAYYRYQEREKTETKTKNVVLETDTNND